MDYAELTEDEGEGARVDRQNPAESLMLRKPLGTDEHEGGLGIDEGSWQHHLLFSWIERGATFGERESELERLELRPSELRLKLSSGAKTNLRSVAHFSDGSSEDVTELTLFSTNDESIVEVDDMGRAKAMGTGDTAIVATYGGAVVTTQVVVPTARADQLAFDFPSNSTIDELVAVKWRKLGIEPASLSKDEVFLRRVYLDLIGTLPTSTEARHFLKDRDPAKRSHLIDQLLHREEYDMYWATRFSDWTGNDNRFTPQPRAKTAWLWHDWLRDKLRHNVPYDEIAAGIVTATTREGRSMDEVAEEYKTVRDNLDRGHGSRAYDRRRTNDIFWQKAGNNRPETVGLQLAYAFLGVRLECAQCHKHPFDRWTQEDFRRFTSFFSSCHAAYRTTFRQR